MALVLRLNICLQIHGYPNEAVVKPSLYKWNNPEWLSHMDPQEVMMLLLENETNQFISGIIRFCPLLAHIWNDWYVTEAMLKYQGKCILWIDKDDDM